MVDIPSPSFDRPIAGQSLTAELGNRPWQQPPQYTTVEEALDYYVPRLSNPEFTENLYDVMESGIPLTTIAEAIQVAGAMEGKHSIDVGILVMPVLIETMAYLAEEAGIEYNAGSNVTEDPDKISDSAMAAIKERIKKKGILPPEKSEPETQEETVEMEEPKGGLMSRRSANGV